MRLLQPHHVHSILQLLATLTISFLTLRFGAGILAWQSANRLETPTYTVVQRLPAVTPSNLSSSSARSLFPKRRNMIEIRKYEPYLIAETTIDEGSMRKAGSIGFGRCAGYIFGKNQSNQPGNRNNNNEDAEKMAMTAPVRSVGSSLPSSSTGEKMAMTSPVRSSGTSGSSGSSGSSTQTSGKTKISFVIGSKYNLRTAPRPLDKNVTVKEVKGHYLAATSFSGPPPSDDRVAREREILECTLEREGVQLIGGRGRGGGRGGETLVYGYHDPVITPNILRRNEVAVMVDGSTVKST